MPWSATPLHNDSSQRSLACGSKALTLLPVKIYSLNVLMVEMVALRVVLAAKSSIVVITVPGLQHVCGRIVILCELITGLTDHGVELVSVADAQSNRVNVVRSIPYAYYDYHISPTVEGLSKLTATTSSGLSPRMDAACRALAGDTSVTINVLVLTRIATVGVREPVDRAFEGAAREDCSIGGHRKRQC